MGRVFSVFFFLNWSEKRLKLLSQSHKFTKKKHMLAPAYWEVGNSMQLPRGYFVILAVRYPADTTFTVKYDL